MEYYSNHDKWLDVNKILNILRQAKGEPLIPKERNPYGKADLMKGEKNAKNNNLEKIL